MRLMYLHMYADADTHTFVSDEMDAIFRWLIRNVPYRIRTSSSWTAK